MAAVPVLLGSLARIPMGMLTDRFGGRIMFALLIAFIVLRLRVRHAFTHIVGQTFINL